MLSFRKKYLAIIAILTLPALFLVLCNSVLFRHTHVFPGGYALHMPPHIDRMPKIIPILLFNIALTENYTGPMVVPYFGPKIENPEDGLLKTSGKFFDVDFKLSYEFTISDGASLEINGGLKNIFNCYQDYFDRGINRDSAYIYGLITPRTLYCGLKFGNFY